MKDDEKLLSTMKDRNEWWNHVFSRVAGKAEDCDLAVAIPPMVLGRILTDADRAVALKERLDRVRLEHMKAVGIPLAPEEKESLSHRSPVGTGITVKMEQREAKCPLCDSTIIKYIDENLPEDRRRLWRCNHCSWSGHICPVCERQPRCLVSQPYECACGGWDSLEEWIEGTSSKCTTEGIDKVLGPEQECPECHMDKGGHKMGCSRRDGKGLTLSMKDVPDEAKKKAKKKKAPKPPSIQKISNELFELAAHIRKEHVPSGAEQMTTLTGEQMLDIALRVKALAHQLEGIEHPLPVVYVEEDAEGEVVGVYSSGYAEFEYPEGGTQTPYEVKGVGKIPGQSIGECECCGDTRRLVRGLCHTCTLVYFEDAERELKNLRDKIGGRVWRVVWLNPGTVSTTTRYFWDQEDANKFAKKLEDKKITVGVESVTVQKWEK